MKNQNILVINAGSSSIKYALYTMPQEKILIKWKIENLKSSSVKYKKILEKLLTQITNEFHIDKVGHRVVHGWEHYHQTIKFTSHNKQKIFQAIDASTQFAPLHNPANKKWILIFQKLLPNIPQYAIFDTAFHQTMPKENFLYPIPYHYYQKYKIRKYGFHGISHQYLSQKAIEILSKNNSKYKHKSKIISCHIGNWASISAILNGKSIENSMWLTTLSGLIMGTRSWDLDPEIIPYLMKKEKLSKKKIEKILYQDSGIKALMHNKTHHMGKIVQLIQSSRWNAQAQFALDMYLNSIIKYIWAYTALLNGVDAIILSWWVLEGNAPEQQYIRKLLTQKLNYLHIKLNHKANNSIIHTHRTISTAKSATKLIVIPSKEELMIAKECFNY